ncbi:MAG: right-handed parallel beta-helix repeat-containing protein, partial [Anaerolineae bacterium]
MKTVTLALLLLIVLCLAMVGASASPVASPADTLVVTNTADSGPGTLRQALLDGQYGDTIAFDPAVFPPTAPVTISLTSALPQIHQGNLTIDASDVGVILDGSDVPGVWVGGLDIVSHGNTIRGFQVSNFSGPGIAIGGANNTIGGDRGVGAGPLGQGNLTSHNDVGIGLWGSHVSSNTISGNLIGSDATGADDLGNRFGVEISEGANDNVLGPDNVIAYNDAGVHLHQGANGNVIGPDNEIAYNGGSGIDVEKPDTLHNTINHNSIHDNGGMGIRLLDGANGNVIGPDNVIAYNGGAGIEVRNQETLHNTITQNSIHDNHGMGIDLWDGGNTELAAPFITDFDLGAGTVTGTACANCTVEIFCDSCSEGKVYEGRTTADGAGAFTLSKGVSFTGPHLTATATDADGSTSEFSIDQTFFCRTPSLKGERYEALVPDTLDFQDRAELAINALTRCTNPEADYAVYFYADLHRNPPVMYKQEPLMGKFMEGLAMMRMISGSQLNVHVDQRWRELFLRWPTESKPVLSGPDGGRQLAWMAINDQLENDPCWREFAEQALESISEAVVHEDDYCYFPDGQGAMPTGWEATYQGWTLQGVTQLYLATGSDTARQLAAELARYLKDHAQVFDGDGHFLARHPSGMGPALHFHHNGNALVGISEYARATGDEEFAAFAKMGYEWARSLGSPLVGFFPEYIDDWP